MNPPTPPAESPAQPPAEGSAPSVMPSGRPAAAPTPRNPALAPRRGVLGRAGPLAVRAGRWCGWLGGALAGLVVLAVAAVLSLPYTDTGSAWLLQALPRVASVTVEGAQGNLLGGSFTARRLRYALTPTRTLQVDDLAWQGLRWRGFASLTDTAAVFGLTDRPAGSGHLGHLTIERVHIGRIDLIGPGDGMPLVLPTALVLPLTVDISALEIDAASIDANRDQPLRTIRARVHLGAGPTALHRLDDVQLAWDRLGGRGSATLGAAAPLSLHAALDLAPQASAGLPAGASTGADALPAGWTAQVQADGPLAQPVLNARVQAHGQALQARALLRIEDAMPLTQLRAELDQLDLAALVSTWPQTALTGQIDLNLDAPTAASGVAPDAAPGALHGAAPGVAPATPALHAQARLRNDAAGALAARRIPVRILALQTAGDLRLPNQGALSQLDLQLGSAAEPAGALKATGRWAVQGSGAGRRIEVAVDGQISDLQPRRLHPASPALQVSGPISWQWQQPWPAAGSAAPATSPADSAKPTAAKPAIQPINWHTTLVTRLTGRLLGSTLPDVTLALDGQADPARVVVKELQVDAGRAHLDGHGQLTRDRAPAVYALRWDGTLQGFDPTPWWPHPPLSTAADPLERLIAAGGHSLNGRLVLDLRAPAPLSGQLDDLSRLRGDATLALQPSRVAALEVQGQVRLHATASDPVQATLGLDLGPAEARTTLALDGRLDPLGTQDHWQLDWHSTDLSRLNPWLRLVLSGTSASPLSGVTDGHTVTDGRWPQLRSSGQMQASAIGWREAPAASPSAPAVTTELRDLALRWQIGTQANDPIEIDATLGRASRDRWQAQDLAMTARGSGAAHQLSLNLARLAWPGASAPAPMPAGAAPTTATGTTIGAPIAAPSSVLAIPALSLQIQSQGGWTHDTQQASLGWRGRLERLVIAEAGSATLATASARAASGVTAAAPTLAPAVASAVASAVVPAQMPNANGNLTLAQLLRPLRLQVDGADLAWSHAPTRQSLRIGPTRASLGDLHLNLQGFSWQHDGAADATDGATGSGSASAGQRISLKAQLESVEVAPWMQRAQPGFGWGGDLRINGRLDAQITPERVDIDALVQRERGDLQITDPDNPRNPQRLGLADLRLGLVAHDGRWRATQTISGGNLGRLDGEQTVQTRASALTPPLGAPVSGQIELQVAQLANWGRWLPAGWRASGQLASSVRLAGQLGAPELSGEFKGSNLAVRNLLLGVDWRDAQIAVQLKGTQADIETLRIRAGDGTVSGSGAIELGAAPRAELKLHAERFAALQRVDRRIVASGDAELVLDERSTVLKGKLRVDEGRIDFSQNDAPSLSDDVTVTRPEDEALTRERAAAARNARTTTLDVRADLGPAFTIKGRGLSSRLAGELHFTNPSNKLAVNGQIRAVDGNFASYGQKLQIDRGLITFNGALDNPRLDIEATRGDVEDVRVGVTVTGTAQAPRIRLFSVPTLTDTERLSWLLLGRAPDGLGRTDLALLQRGAYALIAGESDAPSIIERVGLDQLSVRQSDTGDTRETIVTLGKQLSRRWYVGYERGLNATAGSWQLIYRAAERFTLRAQSGTENALDLIWTWKWGRDDQLLTPLVGRPSPDATAATRPAASPPPAASAP